MLFGRRMWSSAQALVNYGEAVGTMIVAGALADWSLNDRQRSRLGAAAARTRAFLGGVRRRALLDRFAHLQMRRNFLAAVFLCDALIVAYLAHRMSYHGSTANASDVLAGAVLLFVMPLVVAALALSVIGPPLIARLTGRGNLLACLGKCLLAALAANALAYGALRVMNITFLAFGPRASLDWWDARLWIYAAEYAVSGVIVSAMVIASLLLAVLAAAALLILLVMLVLLQAEFLAGIIARYPRGSLLGSSIAVAGLAIVIKDWV
ncbi:MAG TPA: hypothetical protein VKX28_23505 [Xanthobacteraceae bacterium]|nr:hypothetical protein [Xanthobacteraceae bacterium]